MELNQRFANFEEFLTCVRAFGVPSSAVFTTIDSKSTGPNQYIKLGCKHFGELRSRSRGIRPFQKTFKAGCPALIYAKKSEGCVVIKNLKLQHENHSCDANILQQYPEMRRLQGEEKKTAEALVSYNIHSATLQSEVRKLTGKSINIQDLANLRYEMRVQKRGEYNKLEEAIAILVEVLENDPDAVVIFNAD